MKIGKIFNRNTYEFVKNLVKFTIGSYVAYKSYGEILYNMGHDDGSITGFKYGKEMGADIALTDLNKEYMKRAKEGKRIATFDPKNPEDVYTWTPSKGLDFEEGEILG